MTPRPPISGGIAPGDAGAALDALVAVALAEDVGEGDWTTRWTVPVGASGRAEIRAKAPVVVAGLEGARRVFRAVDAALVWEADVEDGDRVEPGDLVLSVGGSLASILTAERTALNILGRLSGIATLTRHFVDAVADSPTRIVDTRKTTPGWRLLEKAAVRAGGGHNHRMGLHDMVLVKENHIAAAGGIAEAVAAVRRANDRGLVVEVEVRSLDELETVLPLGVDRVLLDNMPLDLLRQAVVLARATPGGGPVLEASGNVGLATVAAVAATGVDEVSVGALTHSAPVADLSLRVVVPGGAATGVGGGGRGITESATGASRDGAAGPVGDRGPED